MQILWGTKMLRGHFCEVSVIWALQLEWYWFWCGILQWKHAGYIKWKRNARKLLLDNVCNFFEPINLPLMLLLTFYMLPSQTFWSVALPQQERLWPTALNDQKLYDEGWANCAEVPQCSEPPPVSAACGGIFSSLDFQVAYTLLFIKPEGLLMEVTNS